MSETRWLDEDEEAAWRTWLVLAGRVRAAVGRDLARDHGLSDPEYAVLVNLSESAGHRLRMSELAGTLDWSRSRLSHLLGRMEARGLVERVDCPEDGRSTFAALTGRGFDEITSAAPSHVASVRRHFVDLLDAAGLAQLHALTATMLVRLAEVQQGAAGTGACSEETEPCSEETEPCDRLVDATGSDDCPGAA